ncbi:MAG: patatin-like phospholipase family protein [Planctomycetaceae bacterium]
MGLEQLLSRTGPRRLLALDGGGIRGVITLQVLHRVETILRELTHNPRLVLADYFDYIAGTSIGAVIAACLALGKSIDEMREFYLSAGRDMFTAAGLTQRWRHKFTPEHLAASLKQAIGPDTKLGSPELRTLLMMVLRNATTDSPWPVSSNPRAMFNDRSRPGCNLELPLWQLVRASTAAPTFFPPEVIELEGRPIVFVDGAITTYNNPAFQLFLMATAAPYRLGWATGEDELLLVSVGTGKASGANAGLRPDQMNLLYHATSVPAALMEAASNQQDFLCRTFGRCLSGGPIDLEIGDLLDGAGAQARAAAFRTPAGDVPKLFTYVRYNADLSHEGLSGIGLEQLDPHQIHRIDCPENIPALEQVGQRVARRDVEPAVFARFLPAQHAAAQPG